MINLLIALFILFLPLFSGNPITWWNIGGAVAVVVVTLLTRKWYLKDKDSRSEHSPE
ncbi:hypothetical protein MRBLWO14_001571 [Microbacterium sp. LWO14-1.2]|uniref:hypothetical protein n=1 Tax=Microbacterium sp. LWO14-1.2 TaxID=3135263 RepID=UPI003139D608